MSFNLFEPGRAYPTGVFTSGAGAAFGQRKFLADGAEGAWYVNGQAALKDGDLVVIKNALSGSLSDGICAKNTTASGWGSIPLGFVDASEEADYTIAAGEVCFVRGRGPAIARLADGQAALAGSTLVGTASGCVAVADTTSTIYPQSGIVVAQALVAGTAPSNGSAAGSGIPVYARCL